MDNMTDIQPQIYPVFANELIFPPVSCLLMYAKIIATVPRTNQPKKKLVIPQTAEAIAKAEVSSESVAMPSGCEYCGLTYC